MSLKVTIITVVYNAVNTILDCVESVSMQDYPNIEHIVVDGGSSDGTLEILRDNSRKLSHLISGPDEGLYDAMNKGLVFATGDIVGFLNADDLYANEYIISDYVRAFENNNVECVFSDLWFIDKSDISKKLRYYSSKSFSKEWFRFGMMPAHPTFFTYLKNYKKFGGYRKDFKIASDFDLLLRYLYIHNLPYYYLELVSVHMRVGGLSTKNLLSNILINREINYSCRSNGIYTNLVLIYLKYPFKILRNLRFKF